MNRTVASVEPEDESVKYLGLVDYCPLSLFLQTRVKTGERCPGIRMHAKFLNHGHQPGASSEEHLYIKKAPTSAAANAGLLFAETERFLRVPSAAY